MLKYADYGHPGETISSANTPQIINFVVVSLCVVRVYNDGSERGGPRTCVSPYATRSYVDDDAKIVLR